MTTSDKPAPAFFANLCAVCRAAAERARTSGEMRSSVCRDCAAAILENARIVKTEVSCDENAEITSRELSFVRVDKPAPVHPTPWRWGTNGDDWLRAANGEIVINAGDECTWPVNAYVGELVRVAPEMAQLLDWFAEMGDWIQPVHPNLAKARALLKRLDAARKAGG